ncbi:hypothetical protein EJD97_025108, partial [Solanum chilense]
SKRKSRTVIGRINICKIIMLYSYIYNLYKIIVTFKMPAALRTLFSTILFHCSPSDVRNLWDTYYDDFSKEFHRCHSDKPEAQLQCTLKNIN